MRWRLVLLGIEYLEGSQMCLGVLRRIYDYGLLLFLCVCRSRTLLALFLDRRSMILRCFGLLRGRRNLLN